MKPLLIAALGAAALTLGACVEDFGGAHPPGPYADTSATVFYDGYYGPFAGGYWGMGDYFYYWDDKRSRYRRDHEHHFRRDEAPGYQRYEGRAAPDQLRRPRARPH